MLGLRIDDRDFVNFQKALLVRLGRKPINKITRKALIAPGRIFRDKIKQLVPRRTGGLKKSIKYQVSNFKRRGNYVRAGGSKAEGKFGYRLNFIDRGTAPRYTWAGEYRGANKAQHIGDETLRSTQRPATVAYRNIWTHELETLMRKLKGAKNLKGKPRAASSGEEKISFR